MKPILINEISLNPLDELRNILKHRLGAVNDGFWCGYH